MYSIFNQFKTSIFLRLSHCHQTLKNCSLVPLVSVQIRHIIQLIFNQMAIFNPKKSLICGFQLLFIQFRAMIKFLRVFFSLSLSRFYLYRGTSGIDIDLRRVDIDQCPQRQVPGGVALPLNIFAGTDKCKQRTTEVIDLMVFFFYPLHSVPVPVPLVYVIYCSYVECWTVSAYISKWCEPILRALYVRALLQLSQR